MKLSRVLAASVALALLLPLTARAAEVSGKWKAEFQTQIGIQKYTFDIKATGAKLTGSAAYERMGGSGTADLTEGKVEGDKVSFVEQVDFQGTQLRIEYSGKVAGDEMKLTRRVGDAVVEELVAKRVK
jgi:hypothetical protein